MPKTIAAAVPPTTFTVAMPNRDEHLFEVSMALSPFASAQTTFDLVLPAWTPGSYAIRDYARNVQNLRVAEASGRPLAVAKVDKSRWRVNVGSASRGPFQLSYAVYANELSVRTSHLDATHGYGNGASLFLYAEGRKQEPQRLRFVLPAGWKVSIALPERRGVFEAESYDELVDSPFECGTHRTFDFTVRGKPHTLALWGSGNEDADRLVRDLTVIVEAGAELFGGLPYDRYLFIVHIAAGARGGLEHRASQTVGISPWKFRPDKSYREVLELFAHEHFHAWNVKRIHPAALGPFDYGREVYTRDLWAMEGLTSYYQGVLLARAGLVAPKHLFEAWAKEMKAHRDNPGSEVQSAEDASFDAWIRLYHPDENSPNVSESYYRRGELVGLGLDLTIRKETGGRKSLDDVLRLLWSRWGLRGVGYPEGEVERSVEAVLGPGVKDFFDRYIHGVATPDLADLLTAFGLTLSEKAEKEDDEKEAEEGNGGPPAPVKTKADFGLKTKEENDRLLVAEVYAGRAAYAAGLYAGDELVAFDRVKADEEQIKRIERDAVPGTQVLVTVFRRDRLVEVPLVLGSRRAFTYEIKPGDAASPEQKALFASWLGQPFPEKQKLSVPGPGPVRLPTPKKDEKVGRRR